MNKAVASVRTLLTTSQGVSVPAGDRAHAVLTEPAMAVIEAQAHIASILHGLAYLSSAIASKEVLVPSDGNGKAFDKFLVDLARDVETRCAVWAGRSAGLAALGRDSLAAQAKPAYDTIVSTVTEHAIPVGKKDLVKVAIATLAADTTELESKTPRYQHLVSKKYHGLLAKAQLLDNPNRAALPALHDAVFYAAESITEIMARWGVGDPAEHIELQAAEVATEAAKTALSVIAAVNVIEILSKESDAKHMAQTILNESKDALPQVLRAKLAAIRGPVA